MENQESPVTESIPNVRRFSGEWLIWRLLGDRIEGNLLLCMGLVLTAAASQYAVLIIFPIWAVSRLGVSAATVGIGLSTAGILGAAAAPFGGRISDRIGRRPVMAAGLLATIIGPLLLVGPVPPPVIGLGAYAVCSIGVAARWAAQLALVGDLVTQSNRERGFAAIRVAYNVGAGLGPLLDAGLVLIGFRAVFVAASALSVIALLLLRLVPDPARTKETDSTLGVWSLMRVPVMSLAILASLFAWCVYQALELLLPISLTKSHGYPPYAWGLLFIINPVLIILLQVRIVRWTSALPRKLKMPTACLLMGLPFLLVPAGALVVFIVLLLILFTVGELLFGPVIQAMMVDIAPPNLSGAVLGLLGLTSSISVALTPGLGLGIRSKWGDAAMWFVIAGLSVIAAALFFGLTRKMRTAPMAETAGQ